LQIKDDCSLANAHLAGAGASLIELMIALAIGLFLSAAAVTIYLNGKDAWVARDNLAHLQESGRIALHLIREDLRQAGFWGLNIAPRTIVNTEPIALLNECAPGWATRYLSPVEFANNGNEGYRPCIPDSDHMAETDIITVRRSSSQRVARNSIRERGLYLLTSMTSGKVFSADADSHLDPGLHIDESPAALYRVLAHAYYIRPFSLAPGDGVPTLVREAVSAGRVSAEPLVESIEDLQITFGVDADGDGSVDSYDHNGMAVGETDRVRTVVVELLARAPTVESGYVNRRQYVLGDRSRTFHDGFRRQVFRATVFLRNRPGGDS
jgi:type IV pilus assembly protein PilW